MEPRECITLSQSKPGKTIHVLGLQNGVETSVFLICFQKNLYLYRSVKGAEGNFVKINLKKKSHVKGYALRGAGLRKQVRFEFMSAGLFLHTCLFCHFLPNLISPLLCTAN